MRHSSTLGRTTFSTSPCRSHRAASCMAPCALPTRLRARRRVRRYWLVLAGIAVVVLAAAALVGLRFARSIRGPLAGLERAAAERAPATWRRAPRARRAARGAPARPRVQRDGGEARRARLAQEDFVADASHQLRTPLTALRLRLENLERDVATGAPGWRPRPRRSSAYRVSSSRCSRSRAQMPAALGRAVDLAPPRGRVEAWRPAADRRRTAPARRRPRRGTRGGDRVAQVLDNLLSNALLAAPDGSMVTVTVRRSGAGRAACARPGPGLTDEQQARAFDRFWRGRAAGGTGLGLAIVRRLVEADGGAVELRDAPAAGSRRSCAFLRPETVAARLASRPSLRSPKLVRPGT